MKPIKLIAMFIASLCKVQTVNFDKLTKAFDADAKAESSLKSIQRFIAAFVLDSNLTARLVFSLLPDKEYLALSIDRTNCKFGKTNINILCWELYVKAFHFL